jgi:hypothetical protein
MSAQSIRFLRIVPDFSGEKLADTLSPSEFP